MNNTSTTLASDTQPDQYSHSRQVPFNEIRGTILWINPDDRILRVEGFEEFALDLICAVCFLKAVVDKILSLSVVLVKELS